MSAKTIAAEIADIDRDIATVDSLLATLDEAVKDWTMGVPEDIGEAWNSLHSARAGLVEAKHQVSLPVIPSSEWGTAALVAQNID